MIACEVFFFFFWGDVFVSVTPLAQNVVMAAVACYERCALAASIASSDEFSEASCCTRHRSSSWFAGPHVKAT
jgi:hypothetical protein